MRDPQKYNESPKNRNQLGNEQSGFAGSQVGAGPPPKFTTGLDIAPIKSKIPNSNRIFFTAVLHRNWIYAVQNDCFPELSLMIGENVPRSEIGTRSARMSAVEDLLERSLRTFAGLWGKFHYLCSLRDKSGRYEHWGFIRTHGETSSQTAFAQAHTSVFSQILRTPLAELLQDVELSAEKMSVSTEEFISGLRRVARQATPQNLAGGTLAHFNSVLDALSLVHSARKNLVRQVA